MTWANDLSLLNDFENSIQKLDLALKEFAGSNPDRMAEINNAKASNYLLWGEDLAAKKNYAQGIKMFETVINQYGQSDYYARAFADGAQANYDLATQFLRANKFESAVETLNLILSDYQSSDIQPKAIETMPQALLGWGRNLNANDSFLAAMEKFGEVSNFTQDENILLKRMMRSRLRLDYWQKIRVLMEAACLWMLRCRLVPEMSLPILRWVF